MKRFALLAVAALVALGLMPATAGAGVPTGTGQVTIVHDATYSAEEDFPVTLCVDGDPFAGGVDQDPFVWGDILGPVPLPAGSYDVAIYIGAEQPCEGEPDIGGELMVEAGDDITAAAIWTSAGPDLVVWENDNSCYEAETSARLVVRHGAYTDGPVDLWVEIAGVPTKIIANLAEGEQAVLDLPAPLEVTNGVVVAAGTEDVLITLGDNEFFPGVMEVVYVGGGADGPAGIFNDLLPIEPCEVPVESTTTTTTTAPPAAQPAAVTPRFTG